MNWNRNSRFGRNSGAVFYWGEVRQEVSKMAFFFAGFPEGLAEQDFWSDPKADPTEAYV